MVSEAILSAIESALSGLASGRIYRERREQIPAFPAINIEPQSDEGREDFIGAMDSRLIVAVDVLANGDIPSSAAAPVIAAAWSALAAVPDLGLGSGVQMLPERRVDWDFEDYDTVRGRLSVTYLYRTATGSM